VFVDIFLQVSLPCPGELFVRIHEILYPQTLVFLPLSPDSRSIMTIVVPPSYRIWETLPHLMIGPIGDLMQSTVPFNRAPSYFSPLANLAF